MKKYVTFVYFLYIYIFHLFKYVQQLTNSSKKNCYKDCIKCPNKVSVCVKIVINHN